MDNTKNKLLDFTHQNTLNYNFQKETESIDKSLKKENPCLIVYQTCKNINSPLYYHIHKVNCLDVYAKRIGIIKHSSTAGKQ